MLRRSSSEPTGMSGESETQPLPEPVPEPPPNDAGGARRADLAPEPEDVGLLPALSPPPGVRRTQSAPRPMSTPRSAHTDLAEVLKNAAWANEKADAVILAVKEMQEREARSQAAQAAQPKRTGGRNLSAAGDRIVSRQQSRAS